MNKRLWFARILIAIVIAWNVQCALAFIFSPGSYAAGFELAGIPGAVAVQGMGILFLMWNVPYFVAMWHPQRHILSLKEALVMQFIGLIGESWIYSTLSVEFEILKNSIFRFIMFDLIGLILLILAFGLVYEKPEM